MLRDRVQRQGQETGGRKDFRSSPASDVDGPAILYLELFGMLSIIALMTSCHDIIVLGSLTGANSLLG